MTNMEVIRIAEEEIGRISYLLDCSPQIYDNPGMRKIYERKYEWLSQLLVMAKRATKSCESNWVPHTDPPKSNGRYEVAMKTEASGTSLCDGIMLVIRHGNWVGKDEPAALDFGDHFLRHLMKFQSKVS